MRDLPLVDSEEGVRFCVGGFHAAADVSICEWPRSNGLDFRATWQEDPAKGLKL
jgi:hypothetical protein